MSAASSLPEIVGDCGYRVDPVDVSDLASLLGALPTGDERRAMGESARTRAGRFSWDTAAAELAETFEQAIASS